MTKPPSLTTLLACAWLALAGNSGAGPDVPSAAPAKPGPLAQANALQVEIASATIAAEAPAAEFPLRVAFQDPRVVVKVPSPDGRKLVWRGLEEGKGYFLFLSEADGSGVRRLDLAKNGYQPVWSPDSRRILYSAMDWRIQERNLFIYDLDKGSSKRVFNAAQKVGPLATWTPDGGKIVFTYFDELWIVNANGIGRSLLNLASRLQGGAKGVKVEDAGLFAWSLDGSRLAYQPRHSKDVYLLDLTRKP